MCLQDWFRASGSTKFSMESIDRCLLDESNGLWRRRRRWEICLWTLKYVIKWDASSTKIWTFVKAKDKPTFNANSLHKLSLVDMVRYQDSGLIRMLTGALFKNISALWPFQLQFNGTACSIIVPFVWDIILILMRIAMTLWELQFNRTTCSATVSCLWIVCSSFAG